MMFNSLRLEQSGIQLIDGDRGKNYPKQAEFKPDGHCLFLSAKNVTESGFEFGKTIFIGKERDQKLRAGKLQRGDIVITTRGTIGNVAYYDNSVTFDHVRINSGMIIVRPDVDLWNPRFLYFLMVSPCIRTQIESLTTGSAVPQLPVKDLKKFALPVLPLEVQNKIVQVIGSLSDKIELNRQINQTLEQMAQAIFKSWFVDFDPVHAKVQAIKDGRDPIEAAAKVIGNPALEQAGVSLREIAALFPSEFEESELGLVPKGWVWEPASIVSEVAIGKTPPRKQTEWFSENLDDIKWISIKDMGNAGVYAINTSECLTAEAVDKFNVRRIPDNTVLLSFKLTVGRVAITVGEMLSNEAIAHFKLNKAHGLTTEFLFLYLKQFDFSRLGSTSSIATAVNSRTIKDMPVIVPDYSITEAFGRLVNPIFEKIKVVQLQNETMSTIRDTLLPKLLSGEIRMGEAEHQIEKVI